jgi:hypothetical protein
LRLALEPRVRPDRTNSSSGIDPSRVRSDQKAGSQEAGSRIEEVRPVEGLKPRAENKEQPNKKDRDAGSSEPQ